MTYQEHIEWLMKETSRKSEAYLTTINRKRKNPSSAEVASQHQSYKEWEMAENAYTNFLISTKIQRVNLSDRLPAQMTGVRA